MSYWFRNGLLQKHGDHDQSSHGNRDGGGRMGGLHDTDEDHPSDSTPPYLENKAPGYDLPNGPGVAGTPKGQSPGNVANIIQQQLGGSKFRAMTNAHSFMTNGNDLSFRIGSNSKAVRSVKVTLDPNDTYTMTFYGNKGAVKQSVSGVYNDNLQSVFKEHTGLDTHL